MTNRWLANTGGTRGPEYAERFRKLAAQGQDMHGEARFCHDLLPAPARVLDAGCGTGRVAIELARQGHEVVGVDLDASMLAEARAAAPGLTWVLDDLADLDPHPLGGRRSFDLVVAAGNVMIFLADGTEAEVVAGLARMLRPGGILVAGFSLAGGPGGVGATLDADAYDAACTAAGLTRRSRYAGWGREAWVDGGDYLVAVHAAPPR
ncbi:class I SAM-dependent methyltransferase [Streptomyces sp. SID3343]|uniref:class I SAM-dependent methyltransferase n=1 Tax=Streptomyces sp. SID3343 TaxID=2690260 RepID=UPI00136E9D60|nr:class I SAM-dependent methyltransferase [Streptomyces sp. SID3343]MYV98228.1 methyltransferase domain-containing protein [Streptomyces sp. SID3343]